MEKYKKSYNNNKFEPSAPTGIDEFPLPDTQNHFDYIIKKHKTLTDNPPIQTHVNRIEILITFKIKTRYYLDLVTREIVKLLRSTEKEIS